MNMPQDQSNASLDGQLDLKKRSRRRLVGAAALALVAAIVLPMVMDREPRQPAQDVQVRIPSQDGGSLVARVQPNKPTATPLPAPEAEAKPEHKVESKPQEPVASTPPQPKVEKPVAKPPEKPVEKTADKPAEKATEKPATKSAEKPAEKSAEKPVPSKTEEAKALAALSGAAGTSDQWVVQLGAYKEAGNIKVLLAKLKELGVPVYTENFDSPQGTRTRVRAGPFKSRDDAEKAKTKIRIVGVDGPVAPK
jgi:DedD protein